MTLESFDRGWAVFCEKPLLWRAGMTSVELAISLSKVEAHPARRLFVNTSNATFLDPLLSEELVVEAFQFQFQTRGGDRREAIAVDLLPHALSSLLRVLGIQTIENLETDVAEHRWSCQFRFGGVPVAFELGEDPAATETLSFSLGARRFTRIQEGRAESYRVFLQEAGVGKRFELPDPFRVYIERFLEYCRSGAPVGEDQFDEAAANVRLMSQILLEH